MNRRVAAGGPAGANLQIGGVIGVADIEMAGRNIGALILRVAAEAEIGIVGHQHLAVDGAVRGVANGAAFAEGAVLKNNGPGLLVMARGAGLILSRHRQSACRFKNVAAMRIVAIHTVYMAFDDGVMVRQMQLCFDVQMAGEAGFRLFTRVDDESCRAARFRMSAAGTMTGFAAGKLGGGFAGNTKPRMGTAPKFPNDVSVAFRAGLVANEMRAGNGQRHDHGWSSGGA